MKSCDSGLNLTPVKSSSLRRPSQPASPPAPEPALKILALCLHSLQHLADPLHVRFRLVRPGSRVIFSSVIKVALPVDDRTA